MAPFDAAYVGEVDAILGYLMALKREAIELVDPTRRRAFTATPMEGLALREAGGSGHSVRSAADSPGAVPRVSRLRPDLSGKAVEEDVRPATPALPR